MLTEGSVNPHDILRYQGHHDAVQNYLIQEVQRVYRMQGVDINDKHIEVIVRQMMKKVRVDEAGDTDCCCRAPWWKEPNSIPPMRKSVRRIAAGEAGACVRPPVRRCCWVSPRRLWLPIPSCRPPPSRRPPECSPTPLSRARSTRCMGLKENVIIGKLIPAGTGMQLYNDVELEEVQNRRILDK